MSRRQGYCAAWLAAALVVCGCSHARLVQVNQDDAVVAIPNKTNSWPTYNRKSAEELMQQQFPEGYVIDHEGEVAIGQHTTENVQGNNHSVASVVFGLANETRTTESHNYYEWQIHFHRKGAAPAPAPPPSGTTPATASVPTGEGNNVIQAAGTLPKEPVPAEGTGR
jgi:hypothetical protein